MLLSLPCCMSLSLQRLEGQVLERMDRIAETIAELPAGQPAPQPGQTTREAVEAASQTAEASLGPRRDSASGGDSQQLASSEQASPSAEPLSAGMQDIQQRHDAYDRMQVSWCGTAGITSCAPELCVSSPLDPSLPFSVECPASPELLSATGHLPVPSLLLAWNPVDSSMASLWEYPGLQTCIPSGSIPSASSLRAGSPG